MINRAINLIMQNELIGKALQHETFVETILTAVTTSLEAKDALSARYETILKSVGLVTKSQLDELQEKLDHLTQEAEGLQEQLDYASQTTRSLRQRAEKAEAELKAAQKANEALQAKFTKPSKKAGSKSSKITLKPKSSDIKPSWSPTMTKAELIAIASDLGLKVSSKLKKTDLIERLKSASN